MDDHGLPGKGEPIEHRFLSGGSQNEIYEIRRGDDVCVIRIPPPTAPAPSRRGHPPRVADHRGARRHRRAAHAGGRGVRGPVRARPALLPDGPRRRLVTDGPDGRQRGPHRSTPISRRVPASRTSWSRAPRCCRRSTGRRRVSRASAGPTGSTSARSTAGPPSSSGSRAASCPASTKRRRGCARTGRSTTSPGSCTATTSSPTSCTATARRRASPRSSTGRWARSATRSSTSRGSSRAGPRTRASAEAAESGYVDMTRHAVA